MTETLTTDVNEVIQITHELIQTYKNNLEKEHSDKYRISYRGSIVGLVALLARITDKTAEDYFREIFPKEWEE